jgi:hypothetical protein
MQAMIACNRASRQRPPRDGYPTEILLFVLNPPVLPGFLLRPPGLYTEITESSAADRIFLSRRASSPLRRQSHLPPQVSPCARGPPPGHWQTLLSTAVVVAASYAGLHGRGRIAPVLQKTIVQYKFCGCKVKHLNTKTPTHSLLIASLLHCTEPATPHQDTITSQQTITHPRILF